MIFANVRQQLGRDDAQLALRLVGRASDDEYVHAESLLREQGIDTLLDDPRLLNGLLESRPAMHASYTMFTYVIVRHALRRVGIEDRTLADYLASVMMHFGLRDRAQRIGESDDQTYDTLASMAADVETSDPKRSLLARAHLGNYALWFSGIFPIRSRINIGGVVDRIWITTRTWAGAASSSRHRIGWPESTDWRTSTPRQPSISR